MHRNLKLYFIAGEKSGDLHGGDLIAALKEINPSLKALGVGGPHMQAEGLKIKLPFEDFQVMGFSDVIRELPLLMRHFYALAKNILEDNPDSVVFIDYPGFNLRMARYLRKKGYMGKLIHYIAPSVWAWGKGRIQQMSRNLDLLLTIYPFEADSFKETPLKTVYVGNPLMQHIGISEEKQPLLALFPGSRLKEIERNLPLQIEAATLFLKKHPEFKIAVSVSDPAMVDPALTYLKKASFPYILVEEKNRHALMSRAKVALAKSGTVTLELALQGCPTVVHYSLSRVNFFLARYIFRISLPHYALPNILLKERIFPERYQVIIDPIDLAGLLEQELSKGAFIQEKSLQLKNLLSDKPAAKTAAMEILNLC